MRSENKTLNSWLMQVLGPVLIICMVGSLVFFLIEVLYRGPHNGRLCWVLGLFSIASVLVSRVSIQEGFDRATVFGVALAIATFVTSVTIVDFDYGFKILEPLTIAVLIGVVMWSSSKLTWDCTVVDSSRDVSASGLLVLAGRRFWPARRAREKETEKPTDARQVGEDLIPVNNSQLGHGILSRLFSRSGRQNTPGLWVFYFSLFALPIFGFGQWFVVADPYAGHAWIFFLFAVYLGSGLALLMVTSLLGLDRYLSRRSLPLPGPIAQGWLTMGTLFAVAMMLLVLVIPRPDMTTATSNALAWFSSSVKTSSDMALGNDGQEKKKDGKSTVRSETGKKVPGENPKSAGPHPSSRASQNQPGPGKGSKGSGQKSPSGNRPRSQPPNQQGGQSKPNQPNGQQQSRGPGSQQNKQAGDRGTDEKGKGNSAPSGKPPETTGQAKRPDEEQQRDHSNEGNGQAEGQPADEADQRSSQKESDRQSNRSPADDGRSGERGSSRASADPGASASPAMPNPAGLNSIAKGLVLLIGLAALCVLGWLFRKELAEFWAGLFGGKKKTPEDRPTQREVAIQNPRFSQFADPFKNGRHSKLTERQLVQYTYAALQAWARGHDHEKGPDETPYEFAKQILRFDRTVGNRAMELANLYCRLEYSQQSIHRQELKPLLQLWQDMSSRHLAAV